MPVEEVSLTEFFSVHPPDEARFQIMSRVLEENGLGDTVNIDDVLNLRHSVNLENSDEEEIKVFTDRVEDIDSIMPTLLEWSLNELPDMSGRVRRAFTLENWNRSCEIGGHLLGETESLPQNPTAIEVLNGLITARTAVHTVQEEKEMMEKALQVFTSI